MRKNERSAGFSSRKDCSSKRKLKKLKRMGNTLSIVMPMLVIAILLMCFILQKTNISSSLITNANKLEASEYFSNYKKTSELTNDDIDDQYQKNYQESESDDGSYIIKSAEWTNKENGEAVITIKANSSSEGETTALYVATLCYDHGLKEDIVAENIQQLTKYYDNVDFIGIFYQNEEGIASTRTFTDENTADEIQGYLEDLKKNLSNQFPHFLNSIPAAIQKYLFETDLDKIEIDIDNVVNDPTAIYVSCDTIYLSGQTNSYENWGTEYATKEYFEFIEEYYGNRYFTMSMYYQGQTSDPQIMVRYATAYDTYDENIMNILIGILNPENYGEANEVLSEETRLYWEELYTTDLVTYKAVYLPITDEKYLADYSYSVNLETARVTMIINNTIIDTVSDYFEIIDVDATGGSSDMQITTNGQTVTFYDENYTCGNEVTITIKIKLKTDEVVNIEGFIDTNNGKASLIGEKTLQVESPKLAPITSSYTVNYLDKDTGTTIAKSKIVDNILINTEIEAADEIIEIDGYNYYSVDTDTLIISSTEENVINVYYTRITPTVNTDVTKTSDTDEITSLNQVIDYKIEYTATITDHKGSATITIVDKLPYAIDKSNIVYGDYTGEYDETENTITWKITYDNIDTFTNENPYTIDIKIEFTVVYVGIDLAATNITNTASTSLELKTEYGNDIEPKTEGNTEIDKTIPVDFTVDIYVEKVWEDSENETHRPTSVIMQLTANEDEVEGQKVTLNEENSWSGKFENLPKYTDEGVEIKYSVLEKETTTNDLEYYNDPVITVVKVEELEAVEEAVEEVDLEATEEEMEYVDIVITVTNTYKDMDTELDSTITKTGTEKITSTSELVEYEIKYTVEVEDYIGGATVTIVDYLPYAIDTEADGTNLYGGEYSEEGGKYTITWVEPIAHINTDINNKYEYTFKKNISVLFEDMDITQEKMTNEVIGTIELDEYKDTDEGLSTDDDTWDTLIEVYGTVIAKYLEYGTGTELADPVTTTDKVGAEYETEQKDITGYDFVRVDSEQTASGKYIEGEIIVTYYYQLKDPKIVSKITKLSDTITVTEIDQVIDYTIEYTATITDYKGKATVTIVDYLPYAIDTEADGTNLYGGEYSEENDVYTITWTEPIESIDTYNETNNIINITKEISVVYKNIDVTASTIYNEVKGTIKLETPYKESTVCGDETLPVDFTVDIPVEKIWVDNGNSKEHRPTSVTVVLTADKVETNNSIVLKATEDWKGIFEDLPKYTDKGVEIDYSVVEKETTTNDLEYYGEPEIVNENGTITITNTYKNMDTNLDSKITKTGTSVISSTSDLVEYEINYTVEVDEYIGGATVTIVDYLPYAIDEDAAGTDLAGGTYKESNGEYTITWVEEIDHINTDINDKYEETFTKNISVLFVDIDTTQENMTNRVTGAIELEEYKDEEDKGLDTKGTTFDTAIKIPSKVIVKYIDEDTGEEIADREEIEGYAGDTYNTKQKEIEYYDFVKVEGDTEGKLTEEEKTIIYIYKRVDATVIVRYLEKDDTPDDNSDNTVLAEEDIIEGQAGDSYKAEAKEIYGYEYVEDSGNTEGTMTKNTIYVTYYYEKVQSETVNETYEDIDTGNEEVTENETISNPTTGDTIDIFVGIFVISVAGIVVTIKMRKRVK